MEINGKAVSRKISIRSNMRASIIGGLVGMILLLSVIICFIGNRCIVNAFKNEYATVTHHMAESAAVFVNGDHIDQYLAGEEADEYNETGKQLDISCQKLNVSLIYVIKVDRSDYGRFVSIFNPVNNSVDDSEYTEWELGHKRDTTNDEYREKYRALYEKRSEYETVFRMHPTDSQHPHITTMVPVKDSAGDVTAILCMQRPVNEMNAAIRPYFLLIIIGVLILGTAVCISASGFLNKSIIEPIEKVSKETSRFAAENSKGEPLGTIGRYEVIQSLASSIDSMETDMVNYIDHLTAVTAEKERIGAELSIAALIQKDSLPAIFPPFPGRDEIDIYASMDPAKAVGGDFYNFFFIDDDHLALIIADVSDKGIPAALFMMVTNIVIHDRAQMGGTPAEILRYANDNISEHNRAEMFVTVWLGILEISTGRVIYANAGHEDPAICRSSGKFEMIKEKHGFVLGGMEGMKYADHELFLSKGDKLFLYTDGLPDASDCDSNRFTSGRMLDALNKYRDGSPKDILDGIRKSVNDFVGEAEQFDDLTMLCIEYRGPAPASPSA